MKIPLWLLRLLPMWDYVCPRCNGVVAKNSIQCPHCNEKYGSPLRVPSMMLKDRKRLEKYVHNYVFPRVSKAQRDYLAQYFTELFSDGFESGDFSAWFSTYTGGSGSLSVSSTQKHCGSYACKASFTGAGEAYPTIEFPSPVDDTYCRLYVYWSTVPSNNGQDIYFIEAMNWGTYGNIMVGMRNNYGTLEWVLYDEYGSVRDSSTSPSISASTWYCVELFVKTSGGSGEDGAWVYINGTEELSWTGQTWSSGGIQVLRAGGRIYTGWTVDQYTDCVVVADTYIGPETETQTYTKTWTTDALFKKLGITKTFNVDTALKRQNIPKSFGLDTAFQKNFLVQEQVNAIFKRFGIQKSFALDAHFGTLVTHSISRQIDSVLKRLDATQTFGLDVYFGPVEAEASVEAFGLDVIFAYKVRLPELWLDENGKLVLNISEPYAWVGS